MSVLKLIPQPPGRYVEGSIEWKGKKILDLPDSGLREIRGNQIAMIFQDPMTSLNPIFSIGKQLTETIILHQSTNAAEARAKAITLLELVGIPDAANRLDDYPWQFSGGMRQRVMIALAISCNPELIIADEPTTALDVTIQAQVLDLLNELKEKFSTSIILITHDIGVIAEMCDRVSVMYAGNIVETANVVELFKNPKHPYTKGLLGAIPKLDSPRSEKLIAIPGTIPNLITPPSGCRFHPRCPEAKPECSEIIPKEIDLGNQHTVRCILYEGKAVKT